LAVAYRFVIEPLFTAQVATHADISARLIENFIRRKRQYDEVVMPALRKMGIAPPEDRILEGAWNAVAAQLQSTEADLLQLMEDAREQGTEVLRSRRGRTGGPEIDLSLTAPSSTDSAEVAATVYVMFDGIRGAARDAADEIGRLTPWLSRCADPVAAEFVDQLEELAGQLRPPNVPPGPYAPGEVEANGPAEHAALMSPYKVTFVDCFGPHPDLMDLLPGGDGAAPDFGPLAEEMSFAEDSATDPALFTLSVTYPAAGQNDEEARRFASELYERDRSQHSLPEPAKSSVTVTRI
jgi:hypothetical protein